MKKILVFAAGFLLVMFVSGAGAQEAKKASLKKEPVVNSLVKQVQGEVSNKTKRSISVSISRNEDTGEETEMLFMIDVKNLKIEHKSSFDDIGLGDTVVVVYREETSDYGDRQATKVKADIIRFVKPADVNSVYKPRAAAAAQTQDAADSQDTTQAQDTGALSLKGVK